MGLKISNSHASSAKEANNRDIPVLKGVRMHREYEILLETVTFSNLANEQVEFNNGTLCAYQRHGD